MRAREAEEQAGVRKKRRSLEGSKKCEKKAKEYKKYVAQLTSAVEKIYKHDLLDALEIRMGLKSKSVSVVRQQNRIRDQCMSCRHYNMKLARRERKRSGQLAQRALMIQIILKDVKRRGGDARVARAAISAAVPPWGLGGGSFAPFPHFSPIFPLWRSRR